MNITYQLSLNDYQEGAYFHFKSGKRPIFISLFLGMMTFSLLVGTDFSNTREVIDKILIAFFAISFYLLFTRMVTAYQAKKVYHKSPLLSEEITLRVSGKGIKQGKDASIIPWDRFTQWKKNEHYYLLYTNPHQFTIIPRKVMSDSQEQEFIAYLKKYMSS